MPKHLRCHHPFLYPALLGRTSVFMVAGLAGCKGWRVEQVPPAQLVQEHRPEVVRLTRGSDSAQVKVLMYSPTVAGDSLKGFPTELAIQPFTVALSEVTQIATQHFSATKTILLVLGIGAGAVLYDLLQSLNQTSF